LGCCTLSDLSDLVSLPDLPTLAAAARRGVLAIPLVFASACSPPARELPACIDGRVASQAADSVRVVASGDLVDCAGGAQEQTASLAESLRPDAVLALGDLVYPNATLAEYLDCYAPTWGRLRSVTHAVVGNHEYHTAHAGPFWAYFCGASGPAFHGYYSFALGPWHAIVLNSNCGQDQDVPSYVPDDFGGCAASSPQAQWLERDLAEHTGQCTIAAWHHPRFTSGDQDDGGSMRALWAILQAGGGDVVLNGHAHLYNRFGKLDEDGRLAAEGMRSFVAGAGGHELAKSVRSPEGLEAAIDTQFGVLSLELRATSFAWQFLSAADGVVLDAGEAACQP
jgi:3',5'-cyclic AMP phosphodiesterase CpdA